MRPLYIVCNGGYRTGSTLVYNIARGILDAIGIHYASGLKSHPREVDEELALHRERPYWAVVKCHVWAPMLAVDAPRLRIVYTERNPYDVAASLTRYRADFGRVLHEVQRQALLNAYHRHPETRRLHAPLIVSYEHYFDRPVDLVGTIARHLGIPLNPAQVARVAEETGRRAARAIADGLEPGKQDNRTLLQHRHVGEQWGVPGYGTFVLGEERTAKVAAALAAIDPGEDGCP